MARTLKDLAADLRKYSASLPARSNGTVEQAVLTMIYYLVYQTPVDTSQALSNWQVALGVPVETARSAFYGGEGGSTRNASAQATIAACRRVLEQRKPGQTVYISNVLPYIGALNDGSSLQNPGGFVEAAVLLGQKYVEKIGLSVPNAPQRQGFTP